MVRLIKRQVTSIKVRRKGSSGALVTILSGSMLPSLSMRCLRGAAVEPRWTPSTAIGAVAVARGWLMTINKRSLAWPVLVRQSLATHERTEITVLKYNITGPTHGRAFHIASHPVRLRRLCAMRRRLPFMNVTRPQGAGSNPALQPAKKVAASFENHVPPFS